MAKISKSVYKKRLYLWLILLLDESVPRSFDEGNSGALFSHNAYGHYGTYKNRT